MAKDEYRIGDVPRTDREAALVENTDAPAPKASELKKDGYNVTEKEGDTVAAYSADSPRTDSKPALVELPSQDDAGPWDGLTPTERAMGKRATKAVQAAPHNK